MTSPTVLKIGSGITLGYSPVLAASGVNSVPLHVYSVDQLPAIEEYVMGIYHNVIVNTCQLYLVGGSLIYLKS